MPSGSFEEFKAWANEQIDAVKRREEALSAHSCFQRLHKRRRCDKKELAPILASAAARPEWEWSPALDWLFALAAVHEAAREALLELLSSPKAEIRFRVVASVPAQGESALFEQVLAAGLKDKSARVREKAAGCAMWGGRKKLLPALDAAVAEEKDQRKRQSLAMCRDLLKDGYWLEKTHQGFQVTVMEDCGAMSVGNPITKSQASNPAKLKAAIRALRKGL